MATGAPSSEQVAPASPPRPIIRAAFGQQNRARLLDQFLGASCDSPAAAIYRLILWIDKTVGLAHCYESDKCQPGKNWHARALRFHDWLSQTFNVPPSDVGREIDWLFRHVTEDYAHFMVDHYQRLLVRAAAQRAPFAGRGFPEAGDDPSIVQIVREVLGPNLTGEPTQEQWRELTSRIFASYSVENKRKNIVGEGFEDALAAVIRRADTSGIADVRARRSLNDVPGFANKRQGEKPSKVDIAIVRGSGGRRTLVSAKWSIRADREEQFRSDYGKYVNAQSGSDTFDYVLVTNEFDPARLKRACEMNAGNHRMFTIVVHISPDALRAVYGPSPETTTMREVLSYVDNGRLIGLDAWVGGLVATA